MSTGFSFPFGLSFGTGVALLAICLLIACRRGFSGRGNTGMTVFLTGLLLAIMMVLMPLSQRVFRRAPVAAAIAQRSAHSLPSQPRQGRPAREDGAETKRRGASDRATSSSFVGEWGAPAGAEYEDIDVVQSSSRKRAFGNDLFVFSGSSRRSIHIGFDERGPVIDITVSPHDKTRHHVLWIAFTALAMAALLYLGYLLLHAATRGHFTWSLRLLSFLMFGVLLGAMALLRRI